ncbi:transcription-repair coupling factor [Bacteroides xylanisolvens]|uniref:transcription-repair coupling factor n=1 Tax=Bacteroides xylanisolvens TaxID=371601 RepID=UPI0039B5B847
MIPKSQMYLGARIVENDPEEETPVVPYKGTVTAIEETGKGELDYFVYIRLDDESMKQKRISLCCPDKIMYNPQIQISAESETKRSIFREKDKTKRSKKESAQHSKSRNKSFVMTSVSAL